jgi:hypothetical protein
MDCQHIIGNNRWGLRDGQPGTFRGGKTIEISTGVVHAEYYEAVARGVVWSACTATTGVAPGTSLSTTGALTVHNPIGSGKNLVLLTASMALVSGTLGAGATYLTTHASAAVANPTGTAIVPINLLLGNAATGVALAFTTSSVTTQVPLRPLWSFGAVDPTAAAPDPFMLKDYFNGECVVQPGFGVNLHSIAAGGSTPLVILNLTWEEVAIS